MKKRNFATDYNKYTEDIVPYRFIIRRESGRLIFLFTINGYRGQDTGEIYYSPFAKENMDNIIQEYAASYGEVLSFSMPNILPLESDFSTTIPLSSVNAFDTSDIVFPRPTSVTTQQSHP